MTAFASANGVPITSARIHIPREGVWHGDVVVHDDSLLKAALVLNINGVEFHAQAFRSSVLEGTGVAQFVGGAGGLGLPATPKHYTSSPLSTPLNDILKAAGETLASSADPNVTGLQLNHWTVVEGRCGLAMHSLIDEANAVWRVLTDGTVWVGVESWPTLKLDCQVLLEDVLADRAILHMEEPALIPGVVFNGKRVSYVEHELRQDGSMRTFAWFEKEPP